MNNMPGCAAVLRIHIFIYLCSLVLWSGEDFICDISHQSCLAQQLLIALLAYRSSVLIGHDKQYYLNTSPAVLGLMYSINVFH